MIGGFTKWVDACGLLTEMGVEQISLADTVGLAGPEQIHRFVSAALATDDRVEFGVHLHAHRTRLRRKF